MAYDDWQCGRADHRMAYAWRLHGDADVRTLAWRMATSDVDVRTLAWRMATGDADVWTLAWRMVTGDADVRPPHSVWRLAMRTCGPSHGILRLYSD